MKSSVGKTDRFDLNTRKIFHHFLGGISICIRAVVHFFSSIGQFLTAALFFFLLHI